MFEEEAKMNIKPISRIFEDESGATAIEYGLIAALIAVASISGFSAAGDTVSGVFSKATTEIKGAVAGGGQGGTGGGV